MPWNGNVTGSSVASISQAHGPKEMDRVNRYFSDVDLEALAGDGSVATIRTKTRFRSNKLQFISDDGHIINIIIPVITNDKNVTLPNDSGTLSLGGGGTPISVINNLGVGGVGLFKNAAAGEANFYSLASISSAIDIALDAGNNLVEISLDETVINLSNLAGTLPVSKGGTGQTTKTNAFDALAPTTTAGDIIYRNASGDNVRLAIGPNGYVLGVAGGIPTWIPAPAGGGGGGGGGTDVTLFRNTTVVDVVSTAAETNLFSFTIPANTIGTTGLVRILVTGSYINNSGSDDKYALRLKLGGVTIWSDESGTQSTSSNRRPVFIQLFIKNNNSASSQKVGGTFINGNDVLGDVGISDISSDEIRGQSPIVASSSINTAADAILALSVDHDDSSSNISFQADIISVELVGGTGGGGGTGDITGASNVGSGAGLIFRDEVTGVLNFKSLLAGTNVTITNNADDITIASSGGGGTNNPGGAAGNVQYNNGASAFGAESAFTYDDTNDELTVPGLTINQDLRLNNEQNPPQITANQNDYNPTNLAIAVRLKLTSDASRNITGLAASTDGRFLIINNVGSFPIVLKNEDAASTAANRFSFGSDLTLAAGKHAIILYDLALTRWLLLASSVTGAGEANTASNVGSGTGTIFKQKTGVDLELKTLLAGSNITLTNNASDITIASSGGGAASEFDYIDQATNRVGFIEDFFNIVDKPNWLAVVSGTGAAVNALTVGTEDAHGIVEMNLGTTSSGRAAIVFGHSATLKPLRLAKGVLKIKARIRIPTLSTSTQEFKFEFGLVDDPTSSGANNRLWLEYDRTSALTWDIIASAGGVNSTNDSGVTVPTTWLTLMIEVNAAASLVTYYIDGTSVGTRNTSIPTGVDLFPALTAFKTAGTTARTIIVDYVAFQVDLTTTR